MLRISVAVMVRCPRDIFCFISHCEWNAVCHSGSTSRRAKQRCKWGTLDHLRFSTRAGFRVWSEPKRLLTHICVMDGTLYHLAVCMQLTCPSVCVCMQVFNLQTSYNNLGGLIYSILFHFFVNWTTVFVFNKESLVALEKISVNEVSLGPLNGRIKQLKDVSFVLL